MPVSLHHGDMLDILPRLAADGVRVQSVVCDPPYHLTSIVRRFGGSEAAPARAGQAAHHTGAYARSSRGFMGKQWDGGDIAFRPETWRLCWELLPPGGHLLAFSGTRTYHRMACAIEDAGFEIRDMVADLVASDTAVQAFLASLSDEQHAAFLRCVAESGFGGMLAWIYGTGFPKSHDVAKGIDATARRGSARTTDIRRMAMGDDYQPSGRGRVNYDSGGGSRMNGGLGYEPETEKAREWQGWGTALKPALEPICFARKPLEGTVAGNVMLHRVGAINVDGCRVEGKPRDFWNASERHGGQFGGGGTASGRRGYVPGHESGRWPANVVHDGSAEVVAGFPATKSGQLLPTHDAKPSANGSMSGANYAGRIKSEFGNDSGSAARFFYSAKADAGDRLGSKHPTVKRVDLMRWLVRLVTPPGGAVLDPFAGSGTTGMACLAEGFDAILVERDPEYAADIRRRIAHVSGADTPLFGGGA